MMTKKTYEAVAAILRDQRESEMSGTLSDSLTRYTAEEFATLFAADNPRFSRDQFLTACGVQA